MQCTCAVFSSVDCPAILYCTLSYQRHDFRNKLFSTKCVFGLSLQFCLKPFFILRKTEWDMIKNMLVFMYSTGYSCQILVKLEFSRQIFEKYTNTKFHENPSCGNRVVPRGRTDGRTDGRRYRQTDWLPAMMKLIVTFLNFICKIKNN